MILLLAAVAGSYYFWGLTGAVWAAAILLAIGLLEESL